LSRVSPPSTRPNGSKTTAHISQPPACSRNPRTNERLPPRRRAASNSLLTVNALDAVTYKFWIRTDRGTVPTESKGVRLVVADSFLKFSQNGKFLEQPPFMLGGSRELRTIDIGSAGDPRQPLAFGSVRVGIYKLEGDTLTICDARA